MNYLAHLFLSHDSPYSMLGNFLADFVKGNGEGKFPREVVQGIRNHREVDLFTDSSNIVALSRKLIDKSRCRFSGVIIDVVYDHFLSRNWNLYSDANLDEFIQTVYKSLANHKVSIPQNAERIIEKMVREDWLRSYLTIEGIDKTFKRISKRIGRNNNLGAAVEDLEVNYDSLNADFLRFFPQLITHLRSG
jgi:acyl carrier protein phosphodiesterase